MPRKSKRSQAQTRRWQRSNEIPCTTSTEEAERVGPQSSEAVQGGQHDASSVSYANIVQKGLHSDDATCVSGPSHVQQVNHRGHGDVKSVPQVSHADIVKKGRDSDDPCVGPSHADSVNLRDQPSERHVRASQSQASHQYGVFRNQQCTCNSLTFLGFLHENENLTRADLDLVLDKGNVMYKEARKRVPNHNHLTTDELPDIVPARRYIHHADMTLLSRYGTFGTPLPGAVDSFLDLEAGLSCLLSDVQYALLMMTQLCIAVFRTRSGRYGFFDPHSRTHEGLPRLPGSHTPGTAVMVTFTHLSDMIDRLIKYHTILGTQSSCNYELKPVEFNDVNTAILSAAVPQTESQTTTHTAPLPTLSHDAFPRQSSLSAPKINTDGTGDIVQEVSADMNESMSTLAKVNSDVSATLLQGVATDITSISSMTQQEVHVILPNTRTEPDAPHSESSLSVPLIQTVAIDNVLHNISQKLSKLSKQERRKFKRRLMRSETLCRNEEIKQQCRANYYRNNAEFRKKKKDNLKTRYRENVDFRQKRKQYIIHRYRNNLNFKQKQKEYITHRYRNN